MTVDPETGVTSAEFDELMAIVDRRVGREHSRSGSVAAALTEVLVRHAEMLASRKPI